MKEFYKKLGLKQKKYTRDIFENGRYAASFRPDSSQNPFQRIYDQKRREVVEYIEQNNALRKILDIGSGMARISSAFTASRERLVFCADISFDMLKMGRTRCQSNNSIDFVQSDAHWLPFQDQSFNCIVALDLFCHLKNPESTLREFYRVLTVDGILLIDSTNSVPLWTFCYPRYMGFNPIKWLKIFQFKGVLPGWEGIVTHYTKSQFYSYLSKVPFQINQTIFYGPRICPKWHLAIVKKGRINKIKMAAQ